MANRALPITSTTSAQMSAVRSTSRSFTMGRRGTTRFSISTGSHITKLVAPTRPQSRFLRPWSEAEISRIGRVRIRTAISFRFPSSCRGMPVWPAGRLPEWDLGSNILGISYHWLAREELTRQLWRQGSLLLLLVAPVHGVQHGNATSCTDRDGIPDEASEFADLPV